MNSLTPTTRPVSAHQIQSRYLGRFTATLGPDSDGELLVTVRWDDADATPAARAWPSKSCWPRTYLLRDVIDWPYLFWLGLVQRDVKERLVAEDELEAFAAWIAAAAKAWREVGRRARRSPLAEGGRGF